MTLASITSQSLKQSVSTRQQKHVRLEMSAKRKTVVVEQHTCALEAQSTDKYVLTKEYTRFESVLQLTSKTLGKEMARLFASYRMEIMRIACNKSQD